MSKKFLKLCISQRKGLQTCLHVGNRFRSLCTRTRERTSFSFCTIECIANILILSYVTVISPANGDWKLVILTLLSAPPEAIYSPSGDHAQHFTLSSCPPIKDITEVAVRVSHILREPSSAPEQSKPEFVWNVQVHTPVVWPVSFCNSWPVRASERQTVLSQAAEANKVPSLENEVPNTQPLWGERDCSSFPVSPLHNATVLSAEPDASTPRQPLDVAPGCHERHVTGPRWCRKTNTDSNVLRSHICAVLSQLLDARCSPPGLNSSCDICHLWPLRWVCFSAATLIPTSLSKVDLG